MKRTVSIRPFSQNNVQAALDAVLYIASKEMLSGIKADLGSTETLSSFQDTINRVVQHEIYDKSSGNSGTGNLRKSFKVVKSRRNVFDLTIFSDPAEVKIKAGKYAGTGSYGIFFLAPDEFKSFIEGDDNRTQISYRPFFAPLKREMWNEARNNILKSVKERIRRKLPRKMKLL